MCFWCFFLYFGYRFGIIKCYGAWRRSWAHGEVIFTLGIFLAFSFHTDCVCVCGIDEAICKRSIVDLRKWWPIYWQCLRLQDKRKTQTKRFFLLLFCIRSISPWGVCAVGPWERRRTDGMPSTKATARLGIINFGRWPNLHICSIAALQQAAANWREYRLHRTA